MLIYTYIRNLIIPIMSKYVYIQQKNSASLCGKGTHNYASLAYWGCGG